MIINSATYHLITNLIEFQEIIRKICILLAVLSFYRICADVLSLPKEWQHGITDDVRDSAVHCEYLKERADNGRDFRICYVDVGEKKIDEIEYFRHKTGRAV